MKKELTTQEKRFCHYFLKTMDAGRAARMAGAEDGLAMLCQANVKKELRKLRDTLAEQLCADDMIRRLRELAFAQPNDAVKLAFLPADSAGEIDGLNLEALGEVKRGSNGTTEIKLINRVAALERLISILGGGTGAQEKATEFFRALEEHAPEQ